MNSRHFLKKGLTLPAVRPWTPIAHAQAHSYLEDSPDMLLAYVMGKLNALAAKWDSVRAGIRTPAEAEARNAFVRAKTLEMISGLPERHPLGAVVVRTHQRRGYRIENVMYQSRTNFWVTGNLY